MRISAFVLALAMTVVTAGAAFAGCAGHSTTAGKSKSSTVAQSDAAQQTERSGPRG